ncbi:MAG: ABC transporter substrate-binding protein [Bacteroides sp.]|nr:ABC transporter substrate-binding protein [Eubacterium sp.]MCM1417849.1 ABC transporter substrate-binding protein [Roseburia sp.]MCM1461288.1 ABC transporter substrate-binding protein [Bacteroides sp.]
MKKTWILIYALLLVFLCGCESAGAISDEPLAIEGLTFSERVENDYAEQFAIDRYEGGYSLIQTMNGEKLLIAPEGADLPQKINTDITVLTRPVDRIYLAATSAMGLFAALDCGDRVKFSGTKVDDWYIDYAVDAMKSGEMLYAGKYREPDYELLLTGGCRLSIQSTMIGHSPDVREKLEELGIPVFVDYSSYEPHPLGRSEWIRVYAELCGEAEKAETLFREQAALLQAAEAGENTGKTAVFFYINASGQAVTRKSGDYVTKMIELAGGENVFSDLGDDETASSTVTMETERFYTAAKDADFIIYNSAVGGEVTTIDELILKSGLLADFKAVKNGNVWCTRENLFQETMKLGTVIADLRSIFTENTEGSPPVFLFKLEGSERDG